MNRNIAVTLDRSEELFRELEAEYSKCLKMKSVSARAEQLTHEVAQLLRSVLDRLARSYWEQRVSPKISQEDRQRAKVYFPIASDQHSFDSILGRWAWKTVRDDHQSIVDFLAARQPYASHANRWLAVIDDLATAGKHIDLLPQKVIQDTLTTVSRGSGSISWTSGVQFSGNIRVMGAPIDPRTQRIVPTQGVTEKVERWAAFVIAKHNVNALGFSKEAVAKTRVLADEMSRAYG